MATGTVGTNARKYHTSQLHYLFCTVNYNDAGIATGVATGKKLPAGAIIVGTDVMVETVFNAQTTNVLTVGTNGLTANNIVASGDVNEASAILFQNIAPSGAALGPLSADAEVYVKFTQTGTAATTGKARIVVKYAVDNG